MTQQAEELGPVRLLERLIAIDSVNPGLAASGAGKGRSPTCAPTGSARADSRSTGWNGTRAVRPWARSRTAPVMAVR
jgi:hypothetical protein